jgi:hypothetical protein
MTAPRPPRLVWRVRKGTKRMPEDDTEDKRKEQADAQTSMLRWILGGVGVGIVGIGFFAQVAFNTFMTRDEAQQNFLRQDMKAAIEKMTDVLAKSDDRTDTLVKAVENNTRAVEGLRDDTRLGVWRSVEPPSKLPAK